MEVARRKLQGLVGDMNYEARDFEAREKIRGEIAGLFRTLTWRQATFVYRTGDTRLRSELLTFLLGSLGGEARERFPPGTPRRDIIATLGKPDGDWREILVYTGQDSASDSCGPAILFHLDRSARLEHVGIGP